MRKAARGLHCALPLYARVCMPSSPVRQAVTTTIASPRTEKDLRRAGTPTAPKMALFLRHI
jgi:hypothetical protein